MRSSSIATAFFTPFYVQAFVAFTNNAYTGITTGAPFTLTWGGDNTPVTINLLKGPKEILVKVNTVANAVNGSSFTWTPPPTLIAGTYALSITQSGTTNYSPQFPLASNTTAANATTAFATTHITSITTTYTASAAPSAGVPTLTPVIDSNPPYSTPANYTAVASSTDMASAVGSITPSTTASAPIQMATGGAERIGRVGWGLELGVVVLGAVAVRFAF